MSSQTRSRRTISSLLQLSRLDGKLHSEHRAALGVVCRENLPAMLLDDAVRNRQSQAGSLADLFRRVERFENARQHRVGNARPRIANLYDDSRRIGQQRFPCFDAPMRADRLLSILLLLQARGLRSCQ